MVNKMKILTSAPWKVVSEIYRVHLAAVVILALVVSRVLVVVQIPRNVLRIAKRATKNAKGLILLAEVDQVALAVDLAAPAVVPIQKNFRRIVRNTFKTMKHAKHLEEGAVP